MASRRRGAAIVIPLGVLTLAGGLAVPAGAQESHGRWVAQERREERRDERRDERPPFERREPERRGAPWRFERGHGWRFERGTGVWSPYYAWWWVDQRVVPMAAPTTSVVQYPTGRYELRGDGASVPYSWVWIPAQPMVAAPPPPVGAPAPPDVVLPGPPPPPPAG
jgi:hypothetical protein